MTLAFDLGLAQAKDPDATTVRVLVVARDLGTHDREWSIIVVDRTASRHNIDSTGRASPAPMRPKYPFPQIHLKLAENTQKNASVCCTVFGLWDEHVPASIQLRHSPGSCVWIRTGIKFPNV